MITQLPIDRRTVLRGLGTAIALPMLEAMMPAESLAGSAKPPTRMAFIYVPNGVHMPDWTPAIEGEGFALPYILQPLKPFQNDLLVLSGLANDAARPHGDGAGPHSRAMSAFLTGRHPKKTYGADIQAGISVDQFAAGQVGNQTRFPSLELACDIPEGPEDCENAEGYSCAYIGSLSWKSELTPAGKEVNPRLVFDRLFASQIEQDAGGNIGVRDRSRLSVLDFVTEDARELNTRLGINDRRKVDEYLNGVRELEKRLARVPQTNANVKVTKYDRPVGIPADFQEHIRLMADMIALAFRADLTRIVTVVIAPDRSSRSYGMIGVPENHHFLSHHGGSAEKQSKIRKINHFHVGQLAYLLGKLRSIKEGNGSLLDSCMIVYGSGISDGNAHNNENLPLLLAGRANGTLKTGRHVRYPAETPLMNLYLSMLDRIGAPARSFGDSTGPLPKLG
jgi:hypothetical protein